MSAKDEYHVSYRRLRWWIYCFLRPIFLLFFRVTMRLRVEGLENVPRSGGALMVSNHMHNVDPVLLEAVFPRPVRFMAKKEVFRVPFASWVARMTDSFPVDRGNPDRSALRNAQVRLLGGVIVGMFPEGTRSTTGGLKDVFPGAAAIALRANVPVIPTAVIGTDTLPFNGSKPRRPGEVRVTVRIGKPFYLKRETDEGVKPNLAEITDQMMIEVARLLPEDYRGIYADRVRESKQDVVEAQSVTV
jgi:1-acyl-sn-glycerol-3-phosphate acyltransferase